MFTGGLFTLLWLNLLATVDINCQDSVSPGQLEALLWRPVMFTESRMPHIPRGGWRGRWPSVFVCQEGTSLVNIPWGMAAGLKPEQGCQIKGFLSL